MRKARQAAPGRADDVLWILVSCRSAKEAEAIGNAVLARRAATCFSVFPRTLSRFFWPPRRGRTEEARGALLALETVRRLFDDAADIAREHHRDALPFIGALRLENISGAYRSWMAGELSRTRKSRG